MSSEVERDHGPITVTEQGSTTVLTLSRPEQRNPLSVEMMTSVTEALDLIANEGRSRVVVIRGAGKIFSSGHNLNEMLGKDLAQQQEIFDVCTRMMQKIQQIPQPVIAQVHGIAAAAGCQLVAACDLAVAAESTVFMTPGVKIGLFCSTPMVALSRAVGRKRALQMLLTGEAVDAHTAAEWGLINQVVPADQLEETTAALADRIADASSLTVSIGKQAFYRQIDVSQDEAYELMANTMAHNAVTCDAQEGINAFLSKRQPQWQGR